MKRPNIIFIFSDQQRYDAVGCNGNNVIKTPHLDALAAGGVVFDNAFSSCPICSPYRGQLMTGRYSHANGCLDNEYALFPDQEFLPSVLGKAGYSTAFVGKWHLGYGPFAEDKRYGFDYMAAYNCNHKHNRITYYENQAGPFKMDGWGPNGETDLALRFIENHLGKEEKEPFCLVMSWGPPHWGWGGQLDYDDPPGLSQPYAPEKMAVPPNVPKQMRAFAQKELAQYYGNVTALDNEIGRISEFLKKNNLEKDTILCFSSDHGDHLSSHGYGKPNDHWLHPSMRSSKMSPYEESIHIPFILRYPHRAPAGRRTQSLLNSVDVMPTLLGLAGVEIPSDVQGTDLSYAIVGEDGADPDSVYLQVLGPGWPTRLTLTEDCGGYWRGLRTQRWLYARWFGTGQVWLFDREKDPSEMNNLADDPEYSHVRKELEERLQRWMRETEDPFDSGDRDSRTGMLCLGQQFTHEKWLTYGGKSAQRTEARQECSNW